MNRKKPFSAKQKKKQLQDKRKRKGKRVNIYMCRILPVFTSFTEAWYRYQYMFINVVARVKWLIYQKRAVKFSRCLIIQIDIMFISIFIRNVVKYNCTCSVAYHWHKDWLYLKYFSDHYIFVQHTTWLLMLDILCYNQYSLVMSLANLVR